MLCVAAMEVKISCQKGFEGALPEDTLLSWEGLSVCLGIKGYAGACPGEGSQACAWKCMKASHSILADTAWSGLSHTLFAPEISLFLVTVL